MRCRYQLNERKYDGVLQRGWYRGFIFNADFPVPDSAVAVLGLFYFTDKESSRLTSLVLFFFMGDTVSDDLPQREAREWHRHRRERNIIREEGSLWSS